MKHKYTTPEGEEKEIQLGIVKNTTNKLTEKLKKFAEANGLKS